MPKIVFVFAILLFSFSSFAQSSSTPPPPEIFRVVDKNAEFPGGVDSLYAFLAKNIKYPDSAKQLGKEGVVRIRFVVNKEGFIKKIEVLRPLGYGLDEEAIRVVSLMPKWKPANYNGVAVDSYFNIPVKFTLGNKKEEGAPILEKP